MFNSVSTIFNPNLVCRFYLTNTPDYRMRTLTAANTEKGGICDEQIITSLWEWVQAFTQRLVQENKKIPPTPIPQTNVVMSFSRDYSCFTVNVFSEGMDIEDKITDVVLVIILGTFCQELGKKAGITLEATVGK